MATRSYKIQLIDNQTNQQVDFGPRTIGQVGRDILIVKKALGAIVEYSSLVHEGDNNSSLEAPSGWFDCTSAEKVSDISAATFDRNMQRYLIKFQQDNQFYIMSYLFSKMSLQYDINVDYGFAQKISNIEEPFIFSGGGFIALGFEGNLSPRRTTSYNNSNFTSTQTEILQSLWAREFGSLGEATLAVMHGWRPRTKVGNTSYYHDDNVIPFGNAFDLVLLGLYYSFLQGYLTQKPENTEDILEPMNSLVDHIADGSSDAGSSGFELYKEQVSSIENIASVNEMGIDDYQSSPSYFAAVTYKKVPRDSKSILYSTLESTEPIESRPGDIGLLSEEDFTKSSQRAVEPNPLIDPDPFVIDTNTIGYFMPTQYTISPVSLPPKKADSNYESIIRELEDRALSQILRYYNKPDIWFQSPENQRYAEYYNTDLISRVANHNQRYHTSPSVFVVTTRTIATQKNIDLTQYSPDNFDQPLDPLGDAEDYNRLEYIDSSYTTPIGSDIGPIIKFVEFITPSLRPGDVYRCKFVVDRRKLDLINQGVFAPEEEEGEEAAGPSGSDSSGYNTSTVEAELGASCDNSPLTDLELENRYNEYLALAAANRREVVRAFREASVESYDNKQSADSAIVDLGVVGNTTLRFDTDSEGFGAQVLSGLSSGIGSLYGGQYTLRNAQAANPSVAKMGDIDKDFKFFAEDVRRAASNLKEASENCDQSRIRFSPVFEGQTEVDNMNLAIEDLKKIISVVVPDFNFGESKGSNISEAAGFGDSSASVASTTIDGFFGNADSIRITFSPSTTGAGLRIDTITARGTTIIEARDTRTPINPRAKALLEESKSLNRSRTVAYLAQSNAMAFGSGIGDFFADWALSGAECLEGFGFGKKGLAFIMKYTPALTGKVPDQHNPISRYTESLINGSTDAAKGWWSGQVDNFRSQFLDAEFGVDDTLDLFGPECNDYRELLMDFVYHYSPGKLLCDYARCLKIPAIRIDIPDFNLPPEPDFSIFGWYKGLIGFLMDQWRQILNRILCSFVKMVLEFLKLPICGEHLRDELFGQAAAASPIMQQAFTDALTETFLSEESISKAPELIDDMGKILTGEELCRILQGGPIDGPTMNMLLKIAEKVGIKEINTEETLRKFFETISFFIPESMCEELSQVTEILGSSSCEETSSYLDQIRRQMLANNATDEEIRHALDMANENMMSEATALEALMRGGLQATMPSMVDFSDPSAVLSSLPGNVMEQMASSSKDIFDGAKKGYISSLSAFAPALFINSSRLPRPSDPEYNEEAAIAVETIGENLKLLSFLGSREANVKKLTQQLHVLYQVYETVEYKNTGIRVLQSYEGFDNIAEGTLPQDHANRYDGAKVEYDNRGNYNDIYSLALRPVGVSQDSFTIETNTPQDYSSDVRERRLDTEQSVLSDFRFVYRYKMAKESEVPKATEGVLLELISDRLGELQGILQNNLQIVSTPVNYDGYLDIIKQIISISYENSLEQIRNQREIIEDTTSRRDTQTLNLSANLGPISSDISLLEFKSPENTNSSAFDPYAITISNSPLFRGPQVFEYCDTIPGPGLDEDNITPDQESERRLYEEAISEIPPGLYTRRELFTRKFWNTIRRDVNSIYDTQEEIDSLNDEDRLSLNKINSWSTELPGADFIRRYFYSQDTLTFSEGIFEQIFFSLEKSRMFDVEDYYPELKRRVNGEVYLDSEAGCYKNKYNVSQFGILSFEKMVTDELDTQIRKEMAKPENNPQNLDINDLGPIEKAIQNVALVGFVRVCLVELLLKGSIAYSVWDIESIADEPFFQDFVYKFVLEELENSQILDGKWRSIAERVMGIEQPRTALKKLVVSQIFQVQDSCKKIFKNPTNVDYYNWFITNFVPQTDVSRIVTGGARELLRRDPVTGELLGRDPITGEVVDREGNRVGEIDLDLGEIPKDFYWEHPLYSENRNNEFIEGKKNFFHIEHLLEVRGPLARMESIVLPSREIILDLLHGDLATAQSSRITSVSRQYRNVERLNVMDAFSRFGKELNLDDYSLERFQIPGTAAGTSAENVDDVSAEFEVYHVKDFVEGINKVASGTDVNKLIKHLCGVMAYEEGREEYGEKYSPYESSDGMPESVRRLPTRFIRRHRTIVNLTKDFVTQPISNINDDHLDYYDGLHRWGSAGHFSPTSHFTENESGQTASDYVLGEENGTAQSRRVFDNYSEYVSTSERPTRYYILPSDGEEFFHLRTTGQIEEANDATQFNTLIARDNVHDSIPTDGLVLDERVIVSTFRNSTAVEPIRQSIGAQQNPTGPLFRGHTFGQDLEGDYPSGPGDSLEHDYDPEDQLAPARVYTNPIGKIRNEETYNIIKDTYTTRSQLVDRPQFEEEDWVETVFTFSDAASLIVGMHGSFSIGETQDPSVMNFVPSEELIRNFDLAMTRIQRLYGNAAGADRLRNNAWVEKGTGDIKLTQTDRVLYSRDYEGSVAPFLARPMGIDRSTNYHNTSFWTCASARNRGTKTQKFFSKELANETSQNLLLGKQRARVLLHQVPDVSADGLSYQENNLLPANFYKIPVRVLVTRVYKAGTATPKEVYCKVVPPKYIRNIHDLPYDIDSVEFQRSLEENTEKLNNAISSIMAEYNSFVDQTIGLVSEGIAERLYDDSSVVAARFAFQNGVFTREMLQEVEDTAIEEARAQSMRVRFIKQEAGFRNFPDLTTDFTRDHINDSTPLSVFDDNVPNHQFCSTERIYSKIFERETEEDYFNSDLELDQLFSNPGKLMKKATFFIQSPGIGSMDESAAYFFPAPGELANLFLEDQFDRSLANEYSIKRNRLRSFHFMYDIAGFFSEGSVKDFHRTVFSLANILEDYVSSRRSDSLWGHTSRDHTTGNDVIDTSDMIDILGGPLGTNRFERANLNVYNPSPWRQNVPLCLSYSEKFQWGSNVYADNRVQRRLAAYKKLTPYTIWTMNPLPQKNAVQYWRLNDDGNYGEENLLDGFRTRSEVLNANGDWTGQWKYYEAPWKQPGFCTIFPGERDIEEIAFLDDDYAVRNPLDYRGLVKYLHSHPVIQPHFIGEENGDSGIQIDGPGLNNVNYNKIERHFCKEVSTSLYEGNGELSLLDISMLIQTIVVYIINQSTNRSEIDAPETIFNYESFASPRNEDVLFMALYIADNADEQADFKTFAIGENFINEAENSPLTADQVLILRNSIPKDLLIQALASINYIVYEMYKMSVYATSYSVKSEYTTENEHILTSAYRLYYLHRFLFLIFQQQENYTSSQLMYLLSMAARPNFAKVLDRRIARPNFGTDPEGGSTRMTEYVYNQSLRPYVSLPETLMTSDEFVPVSKGQIYNFFTKLDSYMFEKLILSDSTSSFMRDYVISEFGFNFSLAASGNDAYKTVSSLSLLASDGALEHQKIPYLARTGNRIMLHSEQYTNAFERYSGISQSFLRNALLEVASNSSGVIGGLFRRSEIKQVSRLVANSYLMPDKPSNQDISADASMLAAAYANFVNISNPIQKASEEFRSYVMHVPGEQNSKYLSVPVSSYSETLSEFDSNELFCVDWNSFEVDFNTRKEWMTQELINNNDSKQIFNYIYPIKRYQAISTVFATSMLAGYGGMRRVMTAPKGSLIFLMLSTGMNSAERLDMIDQLSQTELYKTMLDNPTSNFDEFTCADIFPGLFSGIFEDFWDRLGELILLFPAILFRGMASVVDPAYKEMKLHWDNCDIDKLKWPAVKWRSYGNKELTAGLDKIPDGQRNGRYASLLPAFPIDLGYSTGKLFVGETTPMKRTMKRFLGYMYKGPIALMDGAFVFQIPCAQDDPNQWPDEEAEPWNFGRYGHPLSPLTALALTFQELPGDIRQREMSGCGEETYSREQIESNSECPNNPGEQKPFGDMPTPEE